MLHFNLELILKPHVAFERRVNFETPPLVQKGRKSIHYSYEMLLSKEY